MPIQDDYRDFRLLKKQLAGAHAFANLKREEAGRSDQPWTLKWVSGALLAQEPSINITWNTIQRFERTGHITGVNLEALTEFYRIHGYKPRVPDDPKYFAPFISVFVPQRIDFRTLDDPFSNPIDVWKVAPVAVSVLQLHVRLKDSPGAPPSMIIHDVCLRLPDYHEFERYRALYIVALSEGAPGGWLGRVSDWKPFTVQRGAAFVDEVMCRVAERTNVYWKPFLEAAPHMPHGRLTVLLELDIEFPTGERFVFEREWQIANAEMQVCVDGCKHNPERLCRFAQPEVLGGGLEIGYDA